MTLLQQALEALDDLTQLAWAAMTEANKDGSEFDKDAELLAGYKAIDALRTAIAQAEQPVAWRHDHGPEGDGWEYYEHANCPQCQPLYTTPQVPGAEPYAWHYWNNGGASVYHRGPSNQLNADMDAAKMFPAVHHCVPLYTHPQAAKPLSLAQCNELIYQAESLEEKRNVIALIRAVEAAHNIKEQQP